MDVKCLSISVQRYSVASIPTDSKQGLAQSEIHVVTTHLSYSVTLSVILSFPFLSKAFQKQNPSIQERLLHNARFVEPTLVQI